MGKNKNKSSFRNPIRPPVPQKDADYFSENELSLLLSEIPTDKYELRRLSNISVVAFETGLRLDEILHLQNQI